MALAIDVAPSRTTLPIGAAGPRSTGCCGTDGLRHGFSCVDQRGTLVLVFSSNRCPTAKAYAKRINDVQRDVRTARRPADRDQLERPASLPGRELRADGRARDGGRLRIPVRRRRGPGGRARIRGRPARSMSSCSTASVASATRAGSTTRGIEGNVTKHDLRNALERPRRRPRGPHGADEAVRLQPRPGVRIASMHAASGVSVSPSRSLARRPWLGLVTIARAWLTLLMRASSPASRRLLHHHALIEDGAGPVARCRPSSSAGS